MGGVLPGGPSIHIHYFLCIRNRPFWSRFSSRRDTPFNCPAAKLTWCGILHRPVTTAKKYRSKISCSGLWHFPIGRSIRTEQKGRRVLTDMRDTLGVLLAGGAGERLFPLTRDRAKPAVPFGGHYRIIDITLSNCINSGLRKVYVLTQYKALSLNRHIREGWTGIVAQELGEFFELMPPMQRTGANWYMGTADAVYQNIYSIGSEQPKHVIVLSRRPHLQDGLQPHAGHHKETNAEVTLATLPIPPDEVSRFGVVEVGQTGEVLGFQEKPASTTFRSPFNPECCGCVDGDLHLQYRDAAEGAHCGCRRSGLEARLRA